MDKIKFAVVGCGNIGRRHLRFIQDEPGAILTAICDIDYHKAKEQSQLYDNIPCFSDFDTMLLKADADVVSICTPHALHAPMTITTAKSHRHILVEKPMALSSTDCKQMIHHAKKNNVALTIVMQNRYNIPVVIAKKAMDEGHLGKIFMVQCNVLWNRDIHYYQDSDWRGRRNTEGGALYTQASHFVDLLLWWFGDIHKVQTYIETKQHAIEIEDCGMSNIIFQSGVMASLFWTTCVHQANYEGSITVIGEKGTFKIGGKYLNELTYWDVPSCSLSKDICYSDVPNHYGSYQGTSSNHGKVIKEVIKMLRKQPHLLVSGEEGMKTVKAIEQIYSCLS